MEGQNSSFCEQNEAHRGAAVCKVEAPFAQRLGPQVVPCASKRLPYSLHKAVGQAFTTVKGAVLLAAGPWQRHYLSFLFQTEQHQPLGATSSTFYQQRSKG